MAEMRSLYRSLYRELSLATRPAGIEGRVYPLSTLRKSFEKNSATAGQGQQILLYLRSQRTYKTLLEYYNPSIGEDQSDRIRRAARRVGLELPQDIASRRPLVSHGKKGQNK